jgi:hypothetical protein
MAASDENPPKCNSSRTHWWPRRCHKLHDTHRRRHAVIFFSSLWSGITRPRSGVKPSNKNSNPSVSAVILVFSGDSSSPVSGGGARPVPAAVQGQATDRAGRHSVLACPNAPTTQPHPARMGELLPLLHRDRKSVHQHRLVRHRPRRPSGEATTSGTTL